MYANKLAEINTERMLNLLAVRALLVLKFGPLSAIVHAAQVKP